MTRTVGLIWAQAAGGVIGADGGIPWRLPEDQRRFRELTTGHTVVMGRHTWLSLPSSVRPLPGRRNLVLSRDPDFTAEGADVVGTLEAALAAVEGELWVMGGAAVYRAALPLATVAEVTEIDLTVAGDTRAPRLPSGWNITEEGAWQNSRAGLSYRFLTYRRQ